jgi:hypothetical protein
MMTREKENLWRNMELPTFLASIRNKIPSRGI